MARDDLANAGHEVEQASQGRAIGPRLLDERDLARRQVVTHEQHVINEEPQTVRAMPWEVKGAQRQPGELGVIGLGDTVERARPAMAGRSWDIPPGIEHARVLEILRGSRIARRDRIGEDRADVHRSAGQRDVPHHVVPVAVGEDHRCRVAELTDPRRDRVELAWEVRRIDDQAHPALGYDRRVGLPDAAL